MRPRNFKEAAQACIDERWGPMSKARSIDRMRDIFEETSCALCVFSTGNMPASTLPCDYCILSDPGTCCCKEYAEWDKADDEDDFLKAHTAALALVKRLQKIVEGK